MADLTAADKTMGVSPYSPTDVPDVADGAVPSAADSGGSDAQTSSTTATRQESFPRCYYCFKFRRTCDNERPCARCFQHRRTCRNVTQAELDEFPDRVQRLLDNLERQQSTGDSTGAKFNHDMSKRRQESELRHCYRAVNELLSDKYADCNAWFLDPVDHVALNLPHYRSIVEEPMDLSTMKENMEDGEYKTAKQFKKDFIKIVDAARLFNEDGSEVYKAANKLQDVFNVVWDETKRASKKKPEEKAAVETEDPA